MKKICHLTSVHTRYDTRIFFKECISLKDHGYNVYLIVADGKSNEVKNGIDIIDIGKPSNRIIRILFTSWKILIKALSTKAVVIHFHDPELMIIGYILKLLFKKKVIYDIHENYKKTIAERPWIKPKFLKGIIISIYMLIEKLLTRTFDYNIIVIENWSNRYRNSVCVKNYSLFENCQINLKEKENSLVYFGGISKLRGIQEMVSTFIILQKFIPSIKLYLIGPWDDPKEEMALKKKAIPGIHILGYMTSYEAKKYIEKSKLGFCLYTSKKFEENLPVKMFEYLSCSTPVICTNFPTWEEKLKNESWGFAVCPSASEKNAKIIHEVLCTSQYQRMFEACINFRGKYTWKEEENKLINIYQKLFCNS